MLLQRRADRRVLRPFRRKRARASQVNGKPTCAHPELLNDVLRESWGFDGFVVSRVAPRPLALRAGNAKRPRFRDYDAWSNLVTTHKYVSTWEEVAAAGINSGMDQEGGFGDYSPVDALPDAVRDGAGAAATVRARPRDAPFNAFVSMMI